VDEVGEDGGGLQRPELRIISPETEEESATVRLIQSASGRFLGRGCRGRRRGSPGALGLTRGGLL
jgi:hypothetical protein